jgi:hypothetical protein
MKPRSVLEGQERRNDGRNEIIVEESTNTHTSLRLQKEILLLLNCTNESGLVGWLASMGYHIRSHENCLST